MPSYYGGAYSNLLNKYDENGNVRPEWKEAAAAQARIPVEDLEKQMGSSSYASWKQRLLALLRDQNAPDWYNAWANSLSESELMAIADPYLIKTSGGKITGFDEDALTNNLKKLWDYDYALPEQVNYADLWNIAQENANSDVDKLLASLGSDEARRTAEYQDSLNDLRQQYGDARSTLLSKDYQDRARMFDTISSDLSKTRRNALEAGASAGLRIAGNINTMLSAQNKQAQQSMETSNNLAQMLLNQRNAQNALRSDYSNYMSNTTRERNSLEASRYDRASNRFNTDRTRSEDIYNQAMDNYRSDFAATMGADNSIAKAAQPQYEASRRKTYMPGNKYSQ